jgi:hypothetical protein
MRSTAIGDFHDDGVDAERVSGRAIETTHIEFNVNMPAQLP